MASISTTARPRRLLILTPPEVPVARAVEASQGGAVPALLLGCELGRVKWLLQGAVVELLFAIADALREEYRAILDARRPPADTGSSSLP